MNTNIYMENIKDKNKKEFDFQIFKVSGSICKSRHDLECDIGGKIFIIKHMYKKEKDMLEQSKGDRLTVVKNGMDEVCTICGKKFKSKCQLKKHGKVHSDTDKHLCGIRDCSKHKNTGNASNDQKKGTDKQKPVIVCKVCGQIFSSMNSFRVHKKKHLGIRYYCTRCAQSFTTTDQLKIHERGHDDVRSFHCLKCNAQFKRKSNLTRHMAIHEGTRKFVCHICGKAFVLNESLAAHMKVHEDSPPLSCDICQATFKYENSLKTHQKLHSNLKEFKCTICNREFLRKRTLEDHLKCHEKGTNRVALLAKPSEFCTLCSKGFANAYGLKRHMRKHRLGILKHYNRACGKKLENDLKGNPSIDTVVKKNKAPQRNQVEVYSHLIDDGNLFEKIDPDCFFDKRTKMNIKAEYDSTQDKYVEFNQNHIEDIRSDKQVSAEGSEDDLEDNYSNDDVDTLLSKDIDTGFESTHSLDVKARIPKTLDVMENDNDNKEHFNYDDQTNESDKSNENSKIEDPVKCGESDDIGEKAYNVTSNVNISAQYIDGATYTDKAAHIKNTIEHIALELIGDNGLKETDVELYERPEENKEFVPNIDRGELKYTEHLASGNSVDQIVGNNLEFVYEKESDQECEAEIITERLNEKENFQRDTKRINNDGNENGVMMNGSESDELEAMQQGHKNNHSNYNIDANNEILGLECLICETGKLFRNKDCLKDHMQKNHCEIKEYCFECLKCSQKFCNKSDLILHLKNENHDLEAASDLQCKFCMTSYSSQKSLKNHLRKYHRDSDGTIYKCAHCDKMFASRVLYRNHMDVHIIGKSKSRQPCECNLCGSEHKSLVAMRRHKRVIHSIEEEEELYAMDPEENGKIEQENNTKIRVDDLDTVVVSEHVCNTKNFKLAEQGDGKVIPKGIDFDSKNVVSTDKKNQNIPWDNQLSKTSEYLDNIAVDERNNSIDIKHAEAESGSDKGTGKINKKCMESGNNKDDQLNKDLHTNVKHIPKQKHDKDLVSNNITKERFQRKFQCIECDKNFHMMSTLKQHMLGHKKQTQDEAKKYQCEHCYRKFIRKSQLVTHSHKFHSKFTYVCNLCPRKFTSVFCLRTHKCVTLAQSKYAGKSKVQIKSKIAERMKMQDLKCDICNVMFAKRCCLQVHLHLHSTGCNKCPLCQRIFTTEYILKQHIIDDHVKPLDHSTDTDSESNLLAREDVQRQVGKTKVDVTFQCSFCAVRFSSWNNLNRHVKLKHKGNKRLANCEKCIECEQILIGLKKSKVRKKRALPCNSCEQTFPSKLMLRKHMNSAHNVIFNYCNKCSKKFSSLSNLKRHVLIQHSDGDKVQRNFMCNECGQCFTAKDSLRVHMFSHTGERPYRCKLCDATYSRSSHLLRHVKVKHEDRLDHVCNFEGCGKRFYEASTLRIHQRSHTDERPYQCPQCQQRFRTLNNKKTHLRTHLPVKQFECHICLQGLATKHNLLQHLQRHEDAEKLNPCSVRYDPTFKTNKRIMNVKKMEEKRYGCTFCPKLFTTSRGVYAHQRKACQGLRLDGIVGINTETRYYILQTPL